MYAFPCKVTFLIIIQHEILTLSNGSFDSVAIDRFFPMNLFHIRYMRTTSETLIFAGKPYLKITLLVKSPLHKHMEDGCSR